MKKTFISLVCIALCLLFSTITISYAQETKSNIVKFVSVKNNKAISTSTILANVKTKVDEVFTQDVLNNDLKRLYALGYFTDVSVDVKDYDDGLMVTFIVEEKPLVEELNFTGNKEIRSPKLKAKMTIKEGELLDRNKLLKDIAELKKLYESKGFFQIDIDDKVRIDKKLNTAKITIIVNEKQKTKIKNIYIEGNESFSDKEILNIMSTRRDTFFTSGYFKKDVFKEDLERVKLFYQTKGFLDIAVDREFEYSGDKKQLYITLLVDEGKIYLVGDISIEGNEVISVDKLSEAMIMLKDEPFSDEGMKIDVINMQQLYYDEGYIMARIYPAPLLNKQTGNIDIAYKVTEDELIYVNKIIVGGNTKTKDVVIRRELRVYPGEPFDGTKIRRSKERLNNLGFFEEVSFDTEKTDEPNKKDLVVNVKETKTGEFSFGGGYSSIDQFLGFVSVTQRNFDLLNFPTFTGDGQYLNIRAELGMVRNNYTISWTEPWILDYPLSFGFDLYRRGHERKRAVGYGYEESRMGGDLRFAKEFTDLFRGDLIYRLEEVDISNIPEEASFELTREEGDNIISSLGLYLTYDTRDNIFNPTRGYYLNAGIEDAGGAFGGDKDFLKYLTTDSVNFSWFNKNLVLELMGRAGLVSDYGDSDHVPIYERFYAGGASTIRGYRERTVSPKDAITDDPIGGEAMLIGNAELVFPIFKNVIKGALFYDIGNVWEDAEDFGSTADDYKYGAGVGARVKTPMGPLKLDWGYPLKKMTGQEQKGRFYFSMSREF